MGGGGGGGGAAARKTKVKSGVLNPNWAQLQLKIKSGRPSTDRHAKTLAPSILGKRKDRSEDSAAPPEDPPAVNALAPTSDDISLTKALAMDCEMVGVSTEGSRSALGRVTLVNSWGNVVYDEYVRPVERVVDFRTKISGIRPKDMKKAKDFWAVQKKVAELIKGRVLIGHSLRNDFKVLLLSHPKKDTRDTSEYQPFRSREGRKRALKDLAAQILGVKIQQNEHCPIEDARAAMFIYNKYKKEWEKSVKTQFRFKKKQKNKQKKQLEEDNPSSNISWKLEGTLL